MTASARPLPPTPTQDALQLLVLAKEDPTTDLSVAADVLLDAVAARGSLVEQGSRPCTWFGWDVSRSPRRAPTSICLVLYRGGAEPVFGEDFRSVALVLAVAERILLSEDDLDEHVVRLAVEQARAVAS